MESAKLVKATGEPLRALQELENSMRALGLLQDRKDSIDLTGEDDDETKRMKAKVRMAASFVLVSCVTLGPGPTRTLDERVRAI
jgi:predicted methyltransferase